ncbi:NK-tumor recognition protein [Enoplosus armatus]|uniref:NK-tumor recognition protein n=1 Tax=Enoplosus armatus TaxID=215367 RepID=UPI00399144BB
MYRPGKPAHGPPPFGPPPPHGPPFRLGAPCRVPPPGHLPHGPCGPFAASAPDSHFLHNRPPRGNFIRPHCSSFAIDHSTVIALGGRQQIVPPAETPCTEVPQWNPTPVEHHPPDNSERAGEEFLRCIAANKPLPDYLKGNMAYNLADALKSANVLKEAVRSDPEFQKHVTRSKSRSGSRSRGRSRGRSRAKSRARSKSRAVSRSRGRSKSRTRGKSHARGKSSVRSCSKARSRSRSRSKKKSHVRSKSRVRRSKSRSSSSEKSRSKDKKRKRSPSPSCSSVGSGNNLTGNSLLEGLKLVMNSKELEERLPTLKDAILTIQASDESKKVDRMPGEHRHQQHDSQENSTSLENDSMLLPHDRVGSDFSWLQAQSQEDSAAQKANELEDEESFLYGNEDTGLKQASQSSNTLFAAFSKIGEHAKKQEMDSLSLGSQQHHQNKSLFSSFGELPDLKQPLQMTSSSLVTANLDSSECEKIKNILKSLGTGDISEIMVKMQGQREGKQPSPVALGSDPTAAGLALPALSNPNVRQALESLQSLIKATKENRTKRDGSGTSQTSADQHKAGGEEERKREKRARMSKMESLMTELEGLLKQDGLSFLTPVIGFYCQKCEEFIGDLNSAENHAAIHCHSNPSSKVQMDKLARDSQEHLRYLSSSSNQHPHPSDRRDNSDYGYHRDSGDHRNHRDYQRDRGDERDPRSKHTDDHRSHRAGQENISLKEEMRKERMLITVSRGLTPPASVGVKEEVDSEQAAGGRSKVQVEDAGSKGKSSKDSREKAKVKHESSDSSDDDKGKKHKAKSPKKKKKKKEKKKKGYKS